MKAATAVAANVRPTALTALPQDIIFAALVQWGRMPYWRWRSLFQAVVAAGHRVLWVDHFASFGKRELLDWYRADPDHLRERLFEAEPGLHVLQTPLRVPPAAGPLSAAARAAAIRSVRAASARLGMREPVLWLSGPPSWCLVGRMAESGSLYDCIDDLDTLGASRRLLEEERRLSERVDLVLTCLPSVMERKSGAGRRTACVPNGVDVGHFALASRAGSTPASLAALPRPVIGYSGMIYGRIDWPLVAEACALEPEWSFVFVGRIQKMPPASMLTVPNFHLLGEVAYEDLPDHYRAFDACWVPHRVDDVSARQSSLKVYEYLAAGCPTVVSEMPLESGIAGQVSVAGDAAGFVDRLREELNSDRPEEREGRRRVVMAHTWDDRYRRISDALLAAFGERPASRSAHHEIDV